MKKFLVSFFVKVRVGLLSLLAFILSIQAKAQSAVSSDNMANTIIDQSAKAMSGIVPGIIRIMKIATLIGGAISLLLVIFNIIQGERDSAKKAGWWLVGLALGFAVFSVLGNLAVNA